MTYSTSNPPFVVAAAVAGGDSATSGGGNIWVYRSSDTITSVLASHYFSNGDAEGMQVNDVVVILDTTTPASAIGMVTSVTKGLGATVALLFPLSGLLLVTKNASYTFKASDVGCEFAHTDSSGYTWTIDTFANAPIAAGQKIAGFNSSTGTLTIAAPSGGTLTRLDGTSGTGNRTIGASSYFVLHKLDGANAWGITGTALS